MARIAQRLTGFFLFLSISAKPVLACSSCAVASDKARYAYYGTTVLMSLLPLFFVGGVVYYLVKKNR